MLNIWQETASRNYEFDLDLSYIPICLLLAYAAIVIYMKDDQRPAPQCKSSSDNSKEERLLRTIHTGRTDEEEDAQETASLRSLVSHTHSLPDDPKMRSPGTKKHFKCTEFFSRQPTLCLAAPGTFSHLRAHIFDLPPEEYYDTHLSSPTTKPAIEPSDDTLGFSGSQFFFTHDKVLIVKSVPRGFESCFLLDKLLDAYASYMLRSHAGLSENNTKKEVSYSVLTPITDVLYSPYYNPLAMAGIGGEGGVWLVMKNTLLLTPPNSDKPVKASAKWDLKPPHFFEPTRDLVPDKLKTSAAKSGLADAHIPVKDRPVVDEKKKAELLAVLHYDTQFLEKMRVVDYSVLLGRWKRSEFPYDLDARQRWSDGVLSKDGQWVYKVSLVDFLWSQEGGVRPKLTKVAGKVVPDQSVSTEPERYRDAVLDMCDEWVLTKEPSPEEVEEEEEEVDESD